MIKVIGDTQHQNPDYSPLIALTSLLGYAGQQLSLCQ